MNIAMPNGHNLTKTTLNQADQKNNSNDQLDLKTNQYRWNLAELYQSPTDPQIKMDLIEFERLAKKIFTECYDKLDSKLAKGLELIIRAQQLENKIYCYLRLRLAINTTDEDTKKALGQILEKIDQINGEYLTFFYLQLNKLTDEQINNQTDEDKLIQKHRPLIEQQRRLSKYQLSEKVEQALAKRSSFGATAWSRFYDEVEADLIVELPDKKSTLNEALNLLNEGKTSEYRFAVLKAVDQTLSGHFAKYSAETLNNVVREQAVDFADRGIDNSMRLRNLSNQIDDQTVDTLHKTVLEIGAPLTQRFYKLKAKHLGKKVLYWSDRNAKMPFQDNTVIPFTQAKQLVIDAYQKFSPTMEKLVQDAFDKKRIDAHNSTGREGGAFNMSFCLPTGEPTSYTFMTYFGSNRDVATLAHELGHGIHGVLAGQTQGTLLMHAPMAFAETASIFGELLTFELLLEKAEKSGDSKTVLAMLMNKMDDYANTVIRQISFSNFEKRVHNAGCRLSVTELNEIWREVTAEFYGPAGDIFNYEHIDHLWSYVSHFHRPFYVYCYAAAELFVDSLVAQKNNLNNQFEPLFLDLLRSGGTKNAIDMLKPFNLNPTDTEFWKKGIEESFKKWLIRAEKISTEMNITI